MSSTKLVFLFQIYLKKGYLGLFKTIFI